LDKIYGFIIEIILGVLILFAAVLTYFELRTETVTKTLGANTTENLITDVKHNGYMTTGDYEKFMAKLSFTNTLYDVSFEHQYSVFEPKYRLRTLQEILDAQNAAYKGSNIYTYREIKTTAPSVYDPVNTGNLNTETNESVLASSVNTPADPSHVHTPDCYIGHHHNDKPSNFTWHHTHEYGKCVEYVSGQYNLVNCNGCGKEYCNWVAYWYWNNGRVFDKAFATNMSCPYCGATSYSNLHYKYDYGYSCGFIGDLDGDGYKDQIPFNAYRSYPGYNIPQMPAGQTDYTNGCWTYHRNIPIPGYSENSSSFPTICSWDWTVINYILDGSWRKYSNFPRHMKMHYKADGITEVVVDIYFSVADGDVKATVYSMYGNPSRAMPIVDFVNLMKSGATGGLRLVRDSGTYYNLSDEALSNNVSVYYEICNGQGASAVIATGFKPEGWSSICGKSQDDTLDCDKIITSLSPTHPKQTVAINDPLITTVRAIYKDGSAKVVVASASFSMAAICQNTEVTLTYHYSIDGIAFSKSCTITVSVVPRTKICPYGHTYHLRADGSDPGCPYCRAWIKSLRFIYPTTPEMTITIGTSLQDNGVKLLATYMDGRTEIVSSGYEDNLDMNYLGTMVVTVGYKGAGLQLRVTTVCKKVLCTICGNYYALYPDGTDPGCPYCLMKIPVFTGEVMKYDEKTYTEQILNSLYQKGIYYFDKGDIFTVTVKNKSSGMGRKLLQKFIPSLSDRWFDLKRKVRIYSG
jgi:hypothetical protein